MQEDDYDDNDSVDFSQDVMRATYELAKSQMEGGQESLLYDKEIYVQQYFRETEIAGRSSENSLNPTAKYNSTSNGHNKSAYTKSQKT